MVRNDNKIRTIGATLWTSELEEARNNFEAFGRVKDESGLVSGEMIDMRFLEAIGSDMTCAEYGYCENFII